MVDPAPYTVEALNLHWIGLFIVTSGEVKLSTSGPSSKPTKMCENHGSSEYVIIGSFGFYRVKEWSDTLFRYLCRRRKLCSRSGSIPTHIDHLRHQEVGIFVFNLEL